jgi:hypothetical protein
MMEMRKNKLAAAILAVFTGALLFAVPAAANASTYTESYINRCATVKSSGTNQCFQLGAYSTYTSTQIWVNGNVDCRSLSGSVDFTWCGVGGGNGTGVLNIGGNFNMPGVSGLYERMDIKADGKGCSTSGSNSDTGGVTNWWNYYGNPICESTNTSGL